MHWLVGFIVTVVGSIGLASDRVHAADEIAVSNEAECAVMHALLLAELPDWPGRGIAPMTYFLDPLAPAFLGGFSDEGGRPLRPDDDIFRDMFPGTVLSAEEAAGLGRFNEDRGAFRLRCDFDGLRVTLAPDSLHAAEKRQESLVQPRIWLDRPVISRNGQYAIAGYGWTEVAYHTFQEICLLERAQQQWRFVQCAMHPLSPQELEAAWRGPGRIR